MEPVNDKNCYSNIYISPSRFGLVAVCKSGAVMSCPFYHMNDINVCLGRQRGRGEGSPIERTYFTHAFFSLTMSSKFFTS